MLDYQRIVDEVRSSLYAAGPEAAEIVRAAASAYAYACDEVNERLRKCGHLLRSGLRSEALQQSEMEPNLLDVVATLDFPEREIWTQNLPQFGIVVPAPLLLDVAADLNEAYAIEQPLAVLLAKHRLLALARSPLSQRIATIRKIAETDRNNFVWQDDLRLFERERFKQIQAEAAEAFEAEHAPTVVALAEELQVTPWSESLPEGLFERVSKTRAKLVARQAQRELQQIEPQMNLAFSALDLPQMRALGDRWKTNLPLSEFDDQEAVCQRIAPALDWLRDQEAKERHQQEHSNAIATLEQALDDDATGETELDRLSHSATKHGYELPLELERRLRSRIDAVELGAQRRFRLRLVIVSLAAIGIAAAVGLVMVLQNYRASVANHAAALEKLCDESHLTEAQNYVARLNAESPRIATDPKIQTLVVRLNSLIENDASRAKQLHAALDESQTALSSKVADWQSHDRVDRLLKEGERLAHSDVEKADVKRAQLDLSRQREQLQEREDQAFRPELARLSGQVQQLEGQTPDLDGRTAEIARLKATLEKLNSQSARVTPALRNQTKPLLTRLAAIEKNLSAEQQQQLALSRISRAAGDEATFTAALEQYATQYPQSARAADFRRAIEEAGLWTGLVQLSALADRWSQKAHTDVNSSVAKELIEVATPILKVVGDYPEAKDFRDRMSYLEAVAKRGGTGEDSLVAKLKANFSKPWIADFWLVQLTNGDRYYLRLKPDTSDEQWPLRAKYVVDFDLTEKSSIKNWRLGIKTNELAPQAALAADARKALANLTDAKWESTMFSLLQGIYSNQAIDPIPRVTLLRQTMEVAVEGSLPLEKAFRDHLVAVSDSTIDPFANWLDPNDEKAKIARSKADTVLQELPDLKQAGSQAARDWLALRKPVGTRYRRIGWLYRTSGGGWECSADQAIRENGSLVIVRKSVSGGATVIDNVGTLQNGTARISAVSKDALVEGRPVFLAKPMADLAAESK